MIWQLVGYAMISSGVLIDLTSFALGVRRLRGNGPSGIPVIGFAMVLLGLGALLTAG